MILKIFEYSKAVKKHLQPKLNNISNLVEVDQNQLWCSTKDIQVAKKINK